MIAGDINININDSLIPTDYLNVMFSHNCIWCINNYTRITTNSITCIDYIFIKNININNLQALILKCHQKTKYENVFNKININYLNTTLKTENWTSILDSKCPDNALNIFNTKINEAIKSQ